MGCQSFARPLGLTLQSPWRSSTPQKSRVSCRRRARPATFVRCSVNSAGSSSSSTVAPQNLVPVIAVGNQLQDPNTGIRYVVVDSAGTTSPAPPQQGLPTQIIFAIANAVTATALLLFACLAWMRPTLRKMEEASEATEKASLEFEDTCKMMQQDLPEVLQQVQVYRICPHLS